MVFGDALGPFICPLGFIYFAFSFACFFQQFHPLAILKMLFISTQETYFTVAHVH